MPPNQMLPCKRPIGSSEARIIRIMTLSQSDDSGIESYFGGIARGMTPV